MEDYEKIGLKAGLEIHQQLDTKKLFCNCPSLLRNDEPAYTIKRKLNPVTGETGSIDTAAEYEKSRNKTFIYQVYDTNCLVELDEEPPHNINQEALKISIQIALLLNCKIFPVSQIMRKTVINGSNTSGFQRTVLIGHDGYVETSAGKIAIDSVMLEEDSARPVGKQNEEIDEESGKEVIYRLDRLGIPLVEVSTGPHMHTPEQIKEAALKIGEILRACKVKRGIGTIRQDVNISIKGSKRVEIKGFQDPKMMIKTIEEEIKRQKQCLKDKSCISEVRHALPDGKTEFLRPMPGSARMYPETDLHLLKISKSLLDEVKKNLPKLTSENKSYLKDFGLNEEMIKELLNENKVDDFKTLVHTFNKPDLLAKCLTMFPKEISKKESINIDEVYQKLNVHTIEAVLDELDKKISENDVKSVLTKLAKGSTLEESLKKADIDLESEVAKIIKEKPNLSQGAYMGLIMAKFKGQITGKDVADVLKKLMG